MASYVLTRGGHVQYTIDKGNNCIQMVESCIWQPRLKKKTCCDAGTIEHMVSGPLHDLRIRKHLLTEATMPTGTASQELLIEEHNTKVVCGTQALCQQHCKTVDSIAIQLLHVFINDVRFLRQRSIAPRTQLTEGSKHKLERKEM